MKPYMNEYVADDILKMASAKMHALEKVFDVERLSTKLVSELISNAIEESAAEVLTEHTGENWDNAKSDRDADVFCKRTEDKLEIKTTCGDTWRGGEFSRRPGDYLLVKWESFDKFYVTFLTMEESEWKSSGCGNYYATSFGKKELAGRDDRLDLIGELTINSLKNNGEARKVPIIKLKTGVLV